MGAAAAWVVVVVVVVVGVGVCVVAKQPSASINCWTGRVTKTMQSNDTSRRIEVTVATVREGSRRKQ
jgi:hypothetical protein